MKTILFADNMPDFLTTRAQFLKQAGYWVILAHDPDQVEQLMEQHNIHLMILDNRLVNDDDDLDWSGTNISKDPKYAEIAKIILTAFTTYEGARNVMAPRTGGLPAAVDYVGKREPVEDFLLAVKKAFDLYIKINWDLSIKWNTETTTISSLGLLGLLEHDEKQRHPERIAEIEDLLRKAFFECQEIFVLQMLWQRNGKIALAVRACGEHKDEDFLVVLGAQASIAAEEKGYKKFAPSQSPENTRFNDAAYSLHYGLLRYRLAELPLSEMDILKDFLGDRAEQRTYRAIFQKIFESSLKDWRAAKTLPKEAQTLSAFYCRLWPQLRREEFQNAVDQLGRALIGKRLMVDFEFAPDYIQYHIDNQSPRRLVNPAYRLFEVPSRFDAKPLYVNSPGQLNIETVLIDPDKNPWLTEFGHLGEYPFWHDYAALELSLRSALVNSYNFVHLLPMEEALLRSVGDERELNDVEPDYKRVALMINTLRQLAGAEHGFNFREYLLCMFYIVSARFVAGAAEPMRLQSNINRSLHQLLLSCMIASHLLQENHTRPEADAPGQAGLRLDLANRLIQVGGRPVDLSESEFKIIQYLYENRNNVCTYAQILEHALKMSPTDNKNIIVTNISRIRDKMERDAHNPVYLLTVHKKGYKLVDP
jgi:DNA-binding response OmpR family regulator